MSDVDGKRLWLLLKTDRGSLVFIVRSMNLPFKSNLHFDVFLILIFMNFTAYFRGLGYVENDFLDFCKMASGLLFCLCF